MVFGVIFLRISILITALNGRSGVPVSTEACGESADSLETGFDSPLRPHLFLFDVWAPIVNSKNSAWSGT